MDSTKELLKKLSQPTKTINLDDISEERPTTAATQSSETQQRRLLDGFVQTNTKIHFISGNIDKLFLKKKFQSKFDIGVLSIHSANSISRELSVLFKDQAKVHVETGDYLCIFKPDQKEELRKKLIEKIIQARWTKKESPHDHHMLFQVHRNVE